MINPAFSISTDQFRLAFAAGKRAGFFIRHEYGAATIDYPLHTDFVALQPRLFKVVTEALRQRAKQLLPVRLHELVQLHAFHYTRVTIAAARTRWGNCSSQGHICLSSYLMVLPRKLSDYVLLHELCHSREMNQGARFRQLMDRVTGQQSRSLREAFKAFPSSSQQDRYQAS